jgi:predicted anti-sigma-YlaC factor YlaD
MACRNIKNFLPLYSVEALPPREQARVTAHLAQCPACQAELTALTRAVAMLEQLPTPVPPSGLWAGIAAVTVQQPARRLVWWQPAVATATLALLLAGGWLLRPISPTPLSAGGAMANAYAAQYRLSQMQDPLADRAGVGLLLVEDTR